MTLRPVGQAFQPPQAQAPVGQAFQPAQAPLKRPTRFEQAVPGTGTDRLESLSHRSRQAGKPAQQSESRGRQPGKPASQSESRSRQAGKPAPQSESESMQ